MPRRAWTGSSNRSSLWTRAPRAAAEAAEREAALRGDTTTAAMERVAALSVRAAEQGRLSRPLVRATVFRLMEPTTEARTMISRCVLLPNVFQQVALDHWIQAVALAEAVFPLDSGITAFCLYSLGMNLAWDTLGAVGGIIKLGARCSAFFLIEFCSRPQPRPSRCPLLCTGPGESASLCWSAGRVLERCAGSMVDRWKCGRLLALCPEGVAFLTRIYCALTPHELLVNCTAGA